MKEDDKMSQNLDGSNWDGPGGSGGQNGGGGKPEAQSLPERMSRLEGAYRHLATKADLEKLGTELRGEIAGVKDDLSEKIAAQGKELAGISGQLKTLKWAIGIGAAGIIGLLLVILRALLALQ